MIDITVKQSPIKNLSCNDVSIPKKGKIKIWLQIDIQ